MKVSFGKIIPVKVFVDGKESNKEQQIKDVTNILCSNLRKEKHYDNTWQAEQQRRFFAAMVKDYKLPEGVHEYKANDKFSPSNVIGMTIKDPKTGKTDRYLLTGSDKERFVNAGEQYGIEIYNNGTSKERAFDKYNKDLKAMLKTPGALLDKTLMVNVIQDQEAKKLKDQYKIALIDFKA
ncbi:hypothetical protein IKA15_01670 [bacterium]|nr:hypothetical protein [bacterium]